MQTMAVRAIDNMLLHSAYAYFRQSDRAVMDRYGRECFLSFVTAYVNAPKRIAFSAGPTIGLADPFIRLWHESSTRLRDAGRHANQISESELWKRFIESLSWNTAEWSSWMKWQWEGDTPQKFKDLVPGWRDEFRALVPTVVSASPTPTLDLFRQALSNALREDAMNVEYRDEARRGRLTAVDFAIVYCFAMFQRGIAYATRTPDAAVIFHMLRDGAAVTQHDDASDTMQAAGEVEWGRILDASLSRGLISRDEGAFVELLHAFRATVQSDAEYQSTLGQLKPDMSPESVHSIVREAVLRVFLEAKIPLEVRDSNVRGKLIVILDAGIRNSKGINAFLYEIVKIGVMSKTATFVDIALRKSLGKDKVWKIYRIPWLE